MEIINLLLEKGAEVNITDNYRKSSLIYAIINGNNNIVKILLDKDVISLIYQLEKCVKDGLNHVLIYLV